MAYQDDQLFNTAEEFVNFFIHNTLFNCSSKINATYTGRNGYIFRGQSDANWKLTANAFRENAKFENFVPQPPSSIAEKNKINSRLGAQLHSELRAVSFFLQMADSLGISTPLDYLHNNSDIELILSALRDDAEIDCSPIYPSECLNRAFALAQHNGIPTRLLDWSESPLVACYFAAYGASSFCELGTAPKKGQEISVTYARVFAIDKKDSPISIVKAPRSENTFLKQQLGVFTNIKTANSYFLAHEKWPSVEDVVVGTPLNKVRLSANQANEVLRILFNLGISRHSLMPSLEHAAKAFEYIKVLYEKKTD